jgi:hypothetical protein
VQANKNFARDDGGNKALHDVTKSIVMVAMPAENWSKPIEQRYARIGIMTADKQHTHVQGNEGVGQSREFKASISRE